MFIESLIERQRLKKYFEIYSEFKDFTMIPPDVYVKNLILAKRFQHLSGSVVECGVWKGGMIAGIAKLFNDSRNYYLFDSFEGLPCAKEVDGPALRKWQADKESPWYYNNCTADSSYAQRAMNLSGIKNYKIIKGWFSDVLAQFVPLEKITVLRLDGDLYDSTLECLTRLYRYVVPNGVIIIDDYYAWDGCSRAVHDFLSQNQSTEKVYQFHDNVCYLIKR